MPTPDSFYTPAEHALLRREDTMDAICAHVGAGGALQDLVDIWNAQAKAPGAPGGVVRFASIWRWVAEDKARFALWLESNNVAAQADLARADQALRAMAFADIRELFDAQGRVRPVSEWPHDLAMLVQGLDVTELFSKGEEAAVLEGLLKKVKLSDRRAAIEILLKRRGGLVEKREVAGKVTLENIVAGDDEPSK